MKYFKLLLIGALIISALAVAGEGGAAVLVATGIAVF